MSTTTRGIRIQGDPPLAFLRKLQQLEALVASIGQACWVSGPTAGAILGLDGFTLKPPFHITVPRARRVHRHQHLVHRARSITRLDTTTAMGLPCALDSALRDGLTSEDFLHRRLIELRGRGRSGIDRLLAVIAGSELGRGGHSYLERTFLELMDELGFEHPATQQVLAQRKKRLVRVDCHFPGTNVVVELLGYQFHRTPMQMQEDAERVNRLQLDGYVVMQFTYTDVVTRSTVMRETLAEALRRSDVQ